MSLFAEAPAPHLSPAAPPGSPLRFPDGGSWRIEIPSVESAADLECVLRVAGELHVPVHRVSQGSGVFMLTDVEIRDLVELTAAAGVELVLFLGPRGSWDIGGGVRSSSGGSGVRVRGLDQVAACLRDARRATDLGARGLLIADEGVLWACHQLRDSGALPSDTVFKVSALGAPTNPVSVGVWAALGADTINIPSDLTLTQLAEIRHATPVTLDFYLEAPDELGGFVRLHEAGEVIRIAAPVYLKFGLRNAPPLYPAGSHLAATAMAMAGERVRRARIVLDTLTDPTLAVAASPAGSRTLSRPARFTPARHDV